LIYDLNLEDNTYRDIYNTFDEHTTNSNNNNTATKVAKQIHFLLCESCFWCASCLNVDKRTVTNCPSCIEVRLESMPISE
jgi:hypothetical protein